MNWMVKADLPTPALAHAIRQTASHSPKLGLTTTTDDDELVLSQELSLSVIRLVGSRTGPTQLRAQDLETHP